MSKRLVQLREAERTAFHKIGRLEESSKSSLSVSPRVKIAIRAHRRGQALLQAATTAEEEGLLALLVSIRGQLERRTLKELRVLAKTADMETYSDYRKDDLINFLMRNKEKLQGLHCAAMLLKQDWLELWVEECLRACSNPLKT